MEWKISPDPVPYPEAIAFMEARVRDIREGKADEMIWLLEHPALFTAGTSASPSDLIDTLGFPVFPTGRGGQYTYHGPGQRVAYVMLDLKKRKTDVRWFVQSLEAWIIATLAGFGVESFTREGRVGVWVNTVKFPPRLRGRIKEGGGNSFDPIRGLPPTPTLPRKGGGNITEAKIAAIGVRIRQWVSYHGISININPDLSHYRGIVPCGIREYGVTSLEALGVNIEAKEVDSALMRCFGTIFA